MSFHFLTEIFLGAINCTNVSSIVHLEQKASLQWFSFIIEEAKNLWKIDSDANTKSVENKLAWVLRIIRNISILVESSI